MFMFMFMSSLRKYLYADQDCDTISIFYKIQLAILTM